MGQLRRLIEQQTKNTRGGRKRYIPAPDSPDKEATEETKERQTEGHQGGSDAGEKLPRAPQQKQTDLTGQSRGPVTDGARAGRVDRQSR